jgi:hypothetical protein
MGATADRGAFQTSSTAAPPVRLLSRPARTPAQTRIVEELSRCRRGPRNAGTRDKSRRLWRHALFGGVDPANVGTASDIPSRGDVTASPIQRRVFRHETRPGQWGRRSGGSGASLPACPKRAPSDAHLPARRAQQALRGPAAYPSPPAGEGDRAERGGGGNRCARVSPLHPAAQGPLPRERGRTRGGAQTGDVRRHGNVAARRRF